MGAKMSDEFQNKVIVVTGASSGIGKALTLSLLERGAGVVACSRNAEKLEGLQKIPGVRKEQLLTIPCNVSRLGDVERMVNVSVERFERIDGLVNNAGQFPSTSFLELSEEEWNQVMDTNLKGAFLCSRTVAGHMIEQGIEGCIVNISSTASLVARPGVAHYAASKAGLNMFTKVLAVELAPYGIRVNAVLPGLILTEGVQAQLEDPASGAEHQSKLARIPLGHEGRPEDISDAVLHFLSEQSSYSTGALLVVDGGYSLGIPAYVP